MSDVTDKLDLGRILRMQAMVTEAAQVKATIEAGEALVRAYLGLREEMLRVLQDNGLGLLHEEFERLFPILEEPPSFSHRQPHSTGPKLAAAANEAQIGLRKLQGWIQGLINEMTFEQRLRLEAEARVAQESRPPTGFQA